MTAVKPVALPAHAFLAEAREQGAYTDCYVIEVEAHISQAAFVEAFYTTPLFKVERTLLAWLARKPASDADARQLALGLNERFSAWRVERQDSEQLLLADLGGRTKSWLMAAPLVSESGSCRTQLHFGSAVLPVKRANRIVGESKSTEMGVAFHALLGFHRLYSRLLLKSARSKALTLPNAR